MPIRFRCAYCNQLLGIARRKSGTVVRCPTCAGQVVVPQQDAPDLEAPGTAEESPPVGGEEPVAPRTDFPRPALFEQSDFDDVLKPIGGGVSAPTAGEEEEEPSGAWGTHADPPPRLSPRLTPSPPVPAPAPPTPVGIVLSPARATILTVVGILLLAVAFGAGLLVGKFVLGN